MAMLSSVKQLRLAIFIKMQKERSFKIELRALEPSDLDLLYKWENDQSNWKISNTLAPFSKHVLSRYIETAHLDIYQTRQLRLMVDVKIGDTLKTVGAIDIFDFEPFHLRAGIGILIGEQEERRKGYADAALSELKKYLFEVMNLKQVYCNILVKNIDSMNLFKKHGFEIIGIKKKWIKTKDGFEDEAMLQCINHWHSDL